MEQGLTQFDIKILFDEFTYYDNDDDDSMKKTQMMINFKYLNLTWIIINGPVQMWNNLHCLCPYMF